MSETTPVQMTPEDNKHALLKQIDNLALTFDRFPQEFEKGVASNAYINLLHEDPTKLISNKEGRAIARFWLDVNPYMIGGTVLRNLRKQVATLSNNKGKIGTLCLNINADTIFEKLKALQRKPASPIKLDGMLYMGEVLDRKFEKIYNWLERNGAIRLGTETDCQFDSSSKITLEQHIENLQSTGSAFLLDNKCVHFAVNKADNISQWLAAKRNLYTFTWLSKRSMYPSPFIVSTRFCEDLEHIFSLFTSGLPIQDAKEIKVLFVLEGGSKELNERLSHASQMLHNVDKYSVSIFWEGKPILMSMFGRGSKNLIFKQKPNGEFPPLLAQRIEVDKNATYDCIITPIGLVNRIGAYDASITMPVKLPISNVSTSIEIFVKLHKNEPPFSFGKKIVELLKEEFISPEKELSSLIRAYGNESPSTSKDIDSWWSEITKKAPSGKPPRVEIGKLHEVRSGSEKSIYPLSKGSKKQFSDYGGNIDAIIGTNYGAASSLPSYTQPCSSSNPHGQTSDSFQFLNNSGSSTIGRTRSSIDAILGTSYGAASSFSRHTEPILSSNPHGELNYSLGTFQNSGSSAIGRFRERGDSTSSVTNALGHHQISPSESSHNTGSSTMGRAGSQDHIPFEALFAKSDKLPRHTQLSSSSNPHGQAINQFPRNSTNSNFFTGSISQNIEISGNNAASLSDILDDAFVRERGDSTSSVTNTLGHRQISRLSEAPQNAGSSTMGRAESNPNVSHGDGGSSEELGRGRTFSLDANRNQPRNMQTPSGTRQNMRRGNSETPRESLSNTSSIDRRFKRSSYHPYDHPQNSGSNPTADQKPPPHPNRSDKSKKQ